MIGAIGGSVYKWHCTQNRQMRSTEKTYQIEMKMLQGEWLEHIIDIWYHPHNDDRMKAAGLVRHSAPEFLKPSVHGGELWFLEDQSLTYSHC